MSTSLIRSLRGSLLIMTVIAWLPVGVSAQQARLGLYADMAGNDCHLDSGDGVKHAFVVVTKTESSNFGLVAFKATVPTGVAWVEDTVPAYMTLSSGTNSQTGVTLQPSGSCILGENIAVLRISYTASSVLPATAWEVTGVVEAKPMLKDCTSNVMTGKSYTSWINNPGATCYRYQHLAPYNPTPPDGNDSAPLNGWLSFNGDANRIWISTEPFDTPRDQDLMCVTVGGGPCPNPFDPGLLAPYTTYYWMAGDVCDPPSEDCEDALSVVWSFTTGEATLTVKSSTWGAIKALYR